MPVRNDFAAADVLEGALRQASAKVATYTQLRDKLVRSDLACWYGAKYDGFTVDFNNQQKALRRHVGRLDSLAAQVFNATQDAFAAINSRPGQPKKPVLDDSP